MDVSHPTVWAEALRTSPSFFFLFLLPVLWVGVNAKRVATAALVPGLYLRERVTAYLYLFFGAKQIEVAYAKAKGTSFTIVAPDHKITFVSNPQHVKEIDMARPDVLSLFAASKQMYQPEYTMHGFAWADAKGQTGIGFVRTLRTLLTSHMPKMMPSLRSVIETEITKHSTLVNDGIRHLRAFEAMKRTVVTTVGFVFFGQDILPNQAFMDAAYDNIEHVTRAGEAIRLMPKVLAPFLGKMFSSDPNTQEIWHNTLRDIVEHRLATQIRGKDGSLPSDRLCDVVQWIIETAPKEQNWSASRITHEVMALWFGAIHALSISTTFALFALCSHPEYAEPLRAELQSDEWVKFIETSNGLPLLDSFIKESARMQPVDYMTVRRQALKPFSLSNGTHIKPGDWICAPLKSMLYDPQHYPSPDQFDGFRFVRSGIQPEGPSKLTDVTHKWGMWGALRQACPARFSAAVIMKLTMAHILLNFDVELKGKNTKRVTSNWRSYNLPREDLTVLLKPRGGQAQ